MPELFGIAWAVAAVFALLVALPVLRDVVVDGLEHHRRMRARGDDPTDGPAADSSTDDEQSDVAYVECRYCTAENDPEYRYCRRCFERL